MVRVTITLNFRQRLTTTPIENKLKQHTLSAVKKREPGIQAIQRQYNKLCDELEDLIRKKKAPPAAIAPHKIESDKLWTVDVDDAIWQDIGLDDGSSDVEPPGWLADDAVRRGIRAVRELKRCEEEEVFLVRERIAAQKWFAEEWATVNKASELAGKTRDFFLRSPLSN